MIKLDWKNILSEEERIKLYISAFDKIMKCNDARAVEAAIELGHYLHDEGVHGDNYPIFFELLMHGNHFVVDAILGDQSAYDFFDPVETNYYILDRCFEILNKFPPGGLYPRSLEIIYGILIKTYSDPKVGLRKYLLTIEKINAIGKNLDESKKANDPINRLILDFLANIGSLITEDPKVEEVVVHAIDIRNVFFRKDKTLAKKIPDNLVKRENYLDKAVKPREKHPLKPKKGEE